MEATASLLLPVVSCAVALLLLLSAQNPSRAAEASGVHHPLPPSPPAVPIVGPLLWLVRARNRLEPAIRELHRRHGPVLALRFLSPRPAIFVSGRGATHRALVARGPAFASRPPAIAPFRVLNSGQNTVSSAPYGPLWRSLRRNLTSGILCQSRVPLFAPARRRALATLVSDLGRRSKDAGGGVVVVVECLQFAVFSLLTHMCFGRRLHRRRVADIEAVQRELFASDIGFQVFAFCPAVTKLLFCRRWNKVLSIRRRQEELFLPLIRERRDRRGSSMPSTTNGEEPETESLSYCYVDTLLAHRLPKEEGERALTDGEMVSLCTEFLTASVDTTVTALHWIMANLVRQPEVQSKLLDEINAAVTGTDENESGIAEEDLKRMPYLKAVVLEGLRRHPPAHFLLSHAAVEETSLDGHRVPAATSVNFSVADVSMDETVWDRPEEFKPERFVNGGEGAGVDLTGSREIKMMPFGVGRRICPGLGLALLHLEYFVANLVLEFEWGSVAGVGVDLTERPEFTVTMERPLRARVTPRARRRAAVSI
jgi:cytochrome P450